MGEAADSGHNNQDSGRTAAKYKTILFMLALSTLCKRVHIYTDSPQSADTILIFARISSFV